MKRLILFLVMLTAWAHPALAAPASETGIVAVVNDEPISLYDLNNRINLVIASTQLDNSPETRSKLVPQILQTLINETLQLQEARRLDVLVPQDSVNNAIANLERQNNVGNGELKSALEKDGLNYASLLQQVRAAIAWQLLVQRRAAPLMTLSDGEIEDALAEARDTSSGQQIRYAEIYLPVVNPERETTVRQTAYDIFEQVREGAEFQRLARSFSESPSALSGGDAGWLSTGELEPEIRRVLANVEPGFLSEPVRTRSGYMIVLLLEKRQPADAGQVTREQVISTLRRKRLEQVARKYATDLRRDAIVQIRILPTNINS